MISSPAQSPAQPSLGKAHNNYSFLFMIPCCEFCYVSFDQATCIVTKCGHGYCDDCFTFLYLKGFPCHHGCKHELSPQNGDLDVVTPLFVPTIEREDQSQVDSLITSVRGELESTKRAHLRDEATLRNIPERADHDIEALTNTLLHAGEVDDMHSRCVQGLLEAEANLSEAAEINQRLLEEYREAQRKLEYVRTEFCSALLQRV